VDSARAQSVRHSLMKLAIEFEQEVDGRWIAEIRAISGVMAYGKTRKEAETCARDLARRVAAARSEHDEAIPKMS